MDQSLIPLPVLHALEASRQMLSIEPQRVVLLTDTPSASALPVAANIVFAPTNLLSIAAGIAIANPALHVFVISNSNVQYRSEVSALLNAAAQNQNIKLIVRNPNYFDSNSDPLALALSGEASFISRGFIGDPQHLQSLIISATKHGGFAVIDVLEPASGSSKTFASYRQSLEKIATVTKKDSAWQLLQSKSNKIAIGILYQKRQPSFQAQLLERIPSPLVDQSLKNINIKPLLKNLK